MRQADVDDAVQAVFLVLVRTAGTLRKRDSVARWLYGIAWRLARNVNREAIRRARRHGRWRRGNDDAISR